MEKREIHKLDGFKVIELSPLADPDKGEQYILEQYAKLPKEDVDREFRLLPVGQVDAYPVFGDYQRKHHEDPNLVYKSSFRYIYRGWDFGKVHPCVEFLQPDGQKINVIYEVYGTNVNLTQFAQRVLADSGIHFPGASFVDWVDASGVNTPQSGEGRSCIKILQDFGVHPRYRREDVEIGIEKIAKNLTQWTDNRPVIQLNPIRCPHLAAAFRGGYKRNPKGVLIKDGTHDHPCVVGSTKIATPNGYIPIAKIKVGDRVMTRDGWKRVLQTWDNGIKPVYQVTTSGGILVATADHRIWTMNRGWVTVDTLRYGDQCGTIYGWNRSHSTESYSGATQILNDEAIGSTTGANLGYISGALGTSIDIFGNALMGQSQKITMFITRTKTLLTTIWQTLNSYARTTTSSYTNRQWSPVLANQYNCFTWKEYALSQNGGTDRQRDWPGTPRTARRSGLIEGDSGLNANSTERTFNPHIQNAQDSAATTAKLEPFGSVIRVTPAGSERVYDLSVEDTPEYLTEIGIVHNCDAFRYAHQGLMVNITAQFPVKKKEPRKLGPLSDSEQFSRYGRV